MRSFNSGNPDITTDLVQYALSLAQNTDADNQELFEGMIQDTQQYLLQKYFFNENSFVSTTISQQQFYPLPYNYSKLKTGTITVGELRWTPTEILSLQDWDRLNVFPYYSDIPNNFFIYNGQLGFWPIPSTGSTNLAYTALTGTLNIGDTIIAAGATGTILSFSSTNIVVAVQEQIQFTAGAFTDTTSGATGTITTAVVTPGNKITFNYKIRVPNLTLTDYSGGTIEVTNGNETITGTTTAWNTIYGTGSMLNLNVWIRVPVPNGDGNWYQISSVDSATQITLLQPYQGNTNASTTYTIGQMPLLLEDFHDLLVYRPLTIYFSTINKDVDKLKEFEKLYDEGIRRMDAYVGTKALNINLRGAINTINPNSFPQNVGGAPSSS